MHHLKNRMIFHLALVALAGWMVAPLSLCIGGLGDLDFRLLRLPPAGGPNSNAPAVQVADFNGDGNADIVLAVDDFPSDFVVVYFGDGSGDFTTGQAFPAGSYPHVLAVGDFNEDGKVDLAVAAQSSGAVEGVEILLNNGAGGFQSPVFFAAQELLTGLVVGDFNRDGHQDLAATGGVSGHLTVFLGDGAGRFERFGIFSLGTVGDLTVGDFDMDGVPDLAAIGSLELIILQGDGAGGFTVVHTYPLPDNGAGIVTADFNHDNRLDLAVSEINGFPIVVFLGNSDGSFTAGNQVQTPNAEGIAAADFNGDGNIDLAVPTYSSESVLIAFGRGNGLFGPRRTIKFPPRQGTLPYDIAVGDFNRDGRQDLVTADYGTGDAVVLHNIAE